MRPVALSFIFVIVFLLIAVPTTAIADDPNPSTSLASEIDIDHTVSITYEVELPDQEYGNITLTIDVENVNSEKIAFRFPGNEITVLEQHGFDVNGNRIVTNSSTIASITIEYDSSEQIVSPIRHDFLATSEWALFRVMLSTPNHVEVEESVTPEGVRGPTFVFVGSHDIVERSIGSDRFELVVPHAADIADPPSRIAESLNETSRYLRIDGRSDRILAIAAPDPIRRGGMAGLRGEEFWVRADRTLAQNTWGHEYVHLRQDRLHLQSGRWLEEAEAQYYQDLLAFKRGDMEVEGLTEFGAYRKHLRSFDRHAHVRLTDPDSWTVLSDYEKGSRVIAALDVEIRERTDGERDYRHVMHDLNQRPHVTAQLLQNSVEDVVGEPMDEFFDAYVYGTAMPPLPNDADLYRTFPFEPNVSYNLTEEIDTVAPMDADVPHRAVFINETITFRYIIENDGVDPLLYPEVAFEPPAEWSIESFDVDGGSWSITGNETATGTDIQPDTATLAELTLRIPEDPEDTETIGVTLTDADGTHLTRTTNVSPVHPVVANLTVDEPTHLPGTEVTLDGSASTVPGDEATYYWDLDGNGTIDHETDDPVIEHEFEPGTREVELVVVNDIGIFDRTSVRVNTTDVPVIDAPDQIVTEENATFDLAASAENTYGEIEFVWKLPNGQIATGANQTFFTTTSGYYEINVTANDGFGGKNTTTIDVIVADYPDISITMPDAVPADDPVSLTADVDNDVGTYEVTWRLPSGEPVEGNPAQVDLPPGEYNVTATVTDEYGFTANDTHTFVVSDIPTVTVVGRTMVGPGEDVTLNAVISNHIGDHTITWTIDSEPIDDETDHTLTRTFDPGEYEITITIRDEYGLMTQETHVMSVREPTDSDESSTDHPSGDAADDRTPAFGFVAAIIGMLSVFVFRYACE